MNPDDLRYHKEHTWVKASGKKATIGITDYAQEALGDIVYIDLPEVDTDIEPNSEIGEIDARKIAGDVKRYEIAFLRQKLAFRHKVDEHFRKHGLRDSRQMYDLRLREFKRGGEIEVYVFFRGKLIRERHSINY